MIWIIAGALVSYLVGAVPFGLLIGFMKKIDVRKLGSGNIGATNVARVLGSFKWFALVFVFDFLKGLAAPLLFAYIAAKFALPDNEFSEFMTQNPAYIMTLYGLCAILGHMFPIYLKFKGGKGVATGSGVIVALAPASFGIAFGSFLAIFFMTRMVSFASILAAIILSIIHVIFNFETAFSALLPITVLCFLVTLLIVIRHRGNIVRIFKRTEPKIKISKK